jgi:hypothetical protein
VFDVSLIMHASLFFSHQAEIRNVKSKINAVT